ncbi:MAG: carboxypeptidase-like regulatory domain-containing protein [Gemmatimonadaceae bacterium]
MRSLALILLVVAQVASAQRITGVVHDSGSRSPLPGAVVAALDAKGHSLARVISDAAGRYSVAVADSAAQLRVVRIGFQPRVIALASPRPAAVDVGMLKVATLLSTVVVVDDRLCSARGDRAAALSLWEQARAGLLTSIVAREANPANATLIGYERWFDQNGKRVVRQKARKVSGRTTQPFAAPMPPAMLAEQGYLREVNGERLFGAPDADVLLDESFAATHCFSVATADASHAGQVGVAFEPVKGRDRIVDVRGTLWLDAGVPALRAIEFGYAGADAAQGLADASGVIHFHAMANGVVFVDEWHVRLPVMTRDLPPDVVMRRDRGIDSRGMQRGMDVSRTRSSGQQVETGGLVLNARWPDGERWESSLTPLVGLVVERDTQKPMADALVAIEATGDTVMTDAAGRWAIFPIFPGGYEITVLDTSYSSFASPRQKSMPIEVLAAQKEDVKLELTGRASALKDVCDGRRAPGNTALIIGRLVGTGDGASLPRDVRITASWLDGVARAGKGLTFSTKGEAVEPDDRGRFSVCNVPREMVAHLVVSRLGIPFADTAIAMESQDDVREVTWRIDRAALAAIVAQATARFTGRVMQAGKGAPIAGAEVWLASVDRRVTTDDSGRFVLDSLPPGRMLVQVRGVGYVAQRDTLRFVAGAVESRDYALAPVGQQLDTVRTVSDAVKYASPRLRGFEERRANPASGYFIPEAELRKYDNEPLANVLLSRVVGLRIVPGMHGAAFMASSTRETPGAVFGKTGAQPKPCFVTLYVDGVLVYSAKMDAANDPADFNRLAVREYAAVEFYLRSGTAPPGFNATDAGCGTLLLWTRE